MKKTLLFLTILMIFTSLKAQNDNSTYCINSQLNAIELDLKKIDDYYERLHLLYSLNNDERFLITTSDEYGIFYVAPKENLENDVFFEDFRSFLDEKNDEFHSLSKNSVSELEATWKDGVDSFDMLSLMMDIMAAGTVRGDNDSCYKAEPFCTDNGMYTFQAVTGDGHTSESGPVYNCLSSQPCPSWYYMKIATPGQFTIHIEGKDGDTERDVDFCCWGPFDDPMTPCPHIPGPNLNGLTGDKVVDCSYSPNYSEDCCIPESAQTGQYYILLLTNYSMQTCIITFQKLSDSGPGTTDCTIMPPTVEYDNPCYGGTLQLNAHLVSNATYSWTGPNGFTSDQRSPVIENVTFANSGTYGCSISVPGQGTSEPMTLDVEILPELHADFAPDGTCEGTEVHFEGAESTTPAGHNDRITSRTWDFGDGSPTVTEENPTHTFPETGLYEVTYTVVAEENDESGNFCESSITKTVSVFESYTTSFADTTCGNNGYHQHGFDLNAEDLELGMNHKSQTFATVAGCDSIINLDLYVAEIYDITFDDVICYGEEYHGHGFDTVGLTAGLHFMQKQLTTDIGCDSIVSLNLIVGDVYDMTIIDTICHGDSYDKYNFLIINPEAGTVNDTTWARTIFDCDSTVKLNLSVMPSYSYDVADTICEGEDYKKYGLNVIHPTTGTYNLTSVLDTEYGCDSTFNVTLNVKYAFKTPEQIYGLEYVIVASDLISGYYEYSIDTIKGCDEYRWSLENANWILYPDFNKCRILVSEPGLGTLSVKASNNCGEVSQHIDIKGGFYSIDENNSVKAAVYPNPTDGFINIECNGIETVNIINTTGLVIKTLEFGRDESVTIDISDLSDSLYLLEIVTSDGRCMRRIVKR